MSDETTQREWMTLADCAARLKVSVEFVRIRAVKGELRSVTLNAGGQHATRRVRPEWLAEFEASRAPGAVSPAPSPPRPEPQPWRSPITLDPTLVSAALAGKAVRA